MSMLVSLPLSIDLLSVVATIISSGLPYVLMILLCLWLWRKMIKTKNDVWKKLWIVVFVVMAFCGIFLCAIEVFFSLPIGYQTSHRDVLGIVSISLLLLSFISYFVLKWYFIGRNKLKIDGIRYKLDKRNGTARVLPNKYSGDLVIPYSFINPKDGATYLVTGLDDQLFYECSKLTSVTIPDGVTSICLSLTDCKKLTALNIGKGVVDIQICMCYSGKVLESIKVANGNKKYDSRNNCNAIIETATNKLVYGCKNTVIPDDVTKIGDFAFGYCRGLTSITIPEGVTSIGESAFDGCYDLTSITIPSSLIGIGKMAFSLCDSLKDVYCYATVPPSTFDKKFGSKSTTLHVPAASIETYKTTAPWSKFKNIVAIE